MTRRRLLLAFLALGVVRPLRAATLSAQDQADLGRVEAYLNTLRTLHARFLQTAPDGQTSEGQAWLDRPGRMRFQYDPPAPFLLVAGHGLLVFHDSQLGQTSNIPLGETPLGLLLQDNLRLSGNVTVADIARRPGELFVTLYRTATPQEGHITLVFSENSLTLRGWVVTDAQRRQTRIRLYDVQTGGTFDQSLFRFIDPRFFGNNPNSGG